jgi:hypothetical protein
VGFVWDVAPEDAMAALFDDYVQRVYTAIYALAQRRAPEIENWLKENAPWTDRTGNARQTLWTHVSGDGSVIVITLSHGMDYGYFLEVANTGRFAILGPGVDYWGQQIMSDIRSLLR